MYLAAQ